MGGEPGHKGGFCGHHSWRCVRCGQCVRCSRGPVFSRRVLFKVAACAAGALACFLAVTSDQGQALVHNMPVDGAVASLGLLMLGLGAAFVGVATLHASLTAKRRCPHCDNDVMMKLR